ncbi:MAG: hypothetical protein WAX77_15835 [Methylococcaceae bacterium]
MTDKAFSQSLSNENISDIYEDTLLKLNKLAEQEYESEYARAMALKPYRDFINVIDTAYNDARLEYTLDVAKKLLAMNLDIQTVMEVTGLTKETLSH